MRSPTLCCDVCILPMKTINKIGVNIISTLKNSRRLNVIYLDILLIKITQLKLKFS